MATCVVVVPHGEPHQPGAVGDTSCASTRYGPVETWFPASATLQTLKAFNVDLSLAVTRIDINYSKP